MLAPEPFTVSVPDEELDDLRRRLEHTRWPIDFANDDWEYGSERGYMEELVDYWLDEYDWRAHEREINSFANFKTRIDDVPIHFIHERGKGPDPVPLILSHGWPWTFWDFHKVIGPLTDPASFGGDPADAFDVVVPSLPGFGFSVPLTKTGVSVWRTADLWVTLMRDVLGYERFGAQGGDWGDLATSQLGHKYAEHMIGVHLSLAMPMTFFSEPLPGEEDYEPHELENYRAHAGAHGHGHHPRRRPEHRSADDRLRAARLAGRPAGLARRAPAQLERLRRRRRAPLLEGRPAHHDDDLLGQRELRELGALLLRGQAQPLEPGARPDARCRGAPRRRDLPRELAIMPERWIRSYYNLQQLSQMQAGGHFAPMEEPDALVEDVRSFFRPLRATAQ